MLRLDVVPNQQITLTPRVFVYMLRFDDMSAQASDKRVARGWVAFQIFMFVADSDGQVSWAAHVGGIVAGVVLVGILKRRDVKLFDREIVPPHAAELAEEGETVSQGPGDVRALATRKRLKFAITKQVQLLRTWQQKPFNLD